MEPEATAHLPWDPCWFGHGLFWMGLVGFILPPQGIWIWLSDGVLILHWLWGARGQRRGRECSDCSSKIPKKRIMNKIMK